MGIVAFLLSSGQCQNLASILLQPLIYDVYHPKACPIQTYFIYQLFEWVESRSVSKVGELTMSCIDFGLYYLMWVICKYFFVHKLPM